MNKDQKSAEIDKVRERFEQSIAAVLVDFKGLKVGSATKLRREFKKANVEYRVVKNSLIRHALKDSPYKSVVGSLERDTLRTQHKSLTGMTGVAWCKEDPSAAAKVIEAFKKSAGPQGDKLVVKAGLLGNQVKERDWVEAEMSKLPGLKETQSMILATLQAPAQSVVGIINAPAQQLVYVLKAWADKLAEQAGG
jgi:large subunit ribosomal protein L10